MLKPPLLSSCVRTMMTCLWGENSSVSSGYRKEIAECMVWVWEEDALYDVRTVLEYLNAFTIGHRYALFF